MGRSGTWMAMFVMAVAMLGVVAAVDLCAPPPQPAPPPGPDCYSIVLAMADCLGFVQNGSTQAKPSAACCDGMKSVLKQGPQCLCVVFRDSGSLGIAVNITKALELPGACGVSAPPISQCYGAGGSPVAPPTPAPQPPQSSPPPTPSPTTPPPQAAPSPATPPPQAAPSPATPPPQAAPSPATPPPQAAPSPAVPPPQAAPSPSSPLQAPVQPPAAGPPSPPAPAAAPSGDGFSPAPAVPPSSDDDNNSAANFVAVPCLLSAVLGIALLTFHY